MHTLIAELSSAKIDLSSFKNASLPICLFKAVLVLETKGDSGVKKEVKKIGKAALTAKNLLNYYK